MADLQDVVDAVADLTGAPVTLEDRDLHLVASSGHPGPIDAVRQDSILHRRATAAVRTHFESFGIARADSPVRIPAEPVQGLLARWCVPVRWQRVTHGYLWLLDGGRLSAAEVAGALPLAAEAGAVLARRARRRDDLSWLLSDLLSADAERRERAAEQLEDARALPAGPVAVVVLAPPRGAPPLEPVNTWRLPRTVLATTRDDGAVLLVPLGAEGNLQAARSVARRARELVPERSRSAAAGISDPVPALTGVRRGWQQARAAAALAATGGGEEPGAGTGRTAEWASAGAARLLAHARPADLLAAAVTERVRALLRSGDEELVRTARTYLDAAGSAQLAARRLTVHRQTLYHRLRRIEGLTGLDLARGADRLELHLALTLLPLLPEPAGPAGGGAPP